MKNVVIRCLVVFVATLLWIQAGHAASGGESAADRASLFRERLEEAAGELKLTPEQREKLKPILQAEVERLRALHANPSLSRRAKLRELKRIRSEVTPKVKTILTPEQFRRWEEMRAERRGELRDEARRRGRLR